MPILLVQQLDSKRIERLNMFLEVFPREVSIAFHHVDHHWAPCIDVAGLGLVQKVE